jgi:hypothetical protein
MKILHPASSKSRIIKVPLDGNGSDIVKGALLTMGVTAASNMGAFIISGAAAADAVGILLGLHDFSEVGDTTIEDGATRVLGEVEMLAPGDLVAAEYDTADTVALATGGASSGIITGSDDETGCWHYTVSGTGIGNLAYIKSYSGDTATYKSALATANADADTVIRIVAPGRTLVKLNTNRDKLGTDAADGTARFLVLRNEISYNGQDWEELDFTKHHGLNLNGKNAKFRAVGCFQDLAVSPLD